MATSSDYVSAALATGRVSSAEIDSFIAHNPGDYSRIWSAFDLNSEGGLRAIAGAPGSPASFGGGPTPAPSLWFMGGDFETMTLTGEIGGGLPMIGGGDVATSASDSVQPVRVDDSMQSRMSNAMLLPSGSPDYGKWIVIAGVVLVIYLIATRKGSQS